MKVYGFILLLNTDQNNYINAMRLYFNYKKMFKCNYTGKHFILSEFLKKTIAFFWIKTKKQK